VTWASNCNSTVPVGPVALLTDDHIRPCMHLVAFRQLFPELLAVALQRPPHAMVVFLAVDEQHHDGALLDRARFTQLRKLRTRAPLTGRRSSNN
jgi:hypothetical protein